FRSCRNVSRPAHDKRHPMPAFPGAELHSQKIAVKPVAGPPCRLPAPVKHPAIVAGKDNQGIICQAFLVQGGQHLAHHPVKLMDKIAIRPGLTGTDKLWGGCKRMMDICGRKIKEEWFLLMLPDPFDGLILQGRPNPSVLI